MAQRIEIRVPDIGDFQDVEVIEVMVAAGDQVEIEDGLVTIETDKAAMDIPAPVAGTVAEVSLKVGDKVSEGDLVVLLDSEDQQPAPAVAGAGKSAAEEKDSAKPVEIEVRVPDIGDFSDVDVIEVLVQADQEIEAEDPLVTLETDKAAMDIPAPASGRILSLAIKEGDKVSEGDLVVTMLGVPVPSPASQQAPAPEPVAETPAPVRKVEKGLPPIDETSFSRAHAGPSVRMLARELGVDLGQVKGSGLKNRITHDDVKAWVKSVLTGGVGLPGAALPKVPEVDFARFGETETKPLGRIQKISGPRLQAAWINLPHVFQFDEADITELENVRRNLKSVAADKDVKLTPLAFILRACVLALKEFPNFNSSLSADGGHLVYKKYCHLGFAADTPNGLMVPVIRDADKLDIYALAGRLGVLSAKAREGKLTADEMQGGSFTISSLGGIGGTGFTPIINAPEVAIMGVARSAMKPVYMDGKFVPRLILPFSVSYDHRVIDGAQAVRFTSYLASVLADPGKLTAAVS
ncbi:MAG: dihydrolipoyllysine-residue acetyltransferase [Proteobacteria bacterium]|nr:dihydrolipoyllysine-residue acetyltransferase [Pseudomonadota bacterium]